MPEPRWTAEDYDPDRDGTWPEGHHAQPDEDPADLPPEASDG